MAEEVSFVRACQDFFTNGKFGKKVEVSEFKELTYQDKVDLRNMLIGQGYNVSEVKKPEAIQAA